MEEIINIFDKKGYKVTKLSRYNKQGFKINWNSDKQLAKVCRGKDVLINCLGVDINHANDFKKANLVNSFYQKNFYQQLINKV